MECWENNHPNSLLENSKCRTKSGAFDPHIQCVALTAHSIPRYIIVNSGSIRFDLVQGPFTYDDSFIVSPFDDAFQYIASVPYKFAKNVLGGLNGAVLPDKRSSPNLGSRLYVSLL